MCGTCRYDQSILKTAKNTKEDKFEILEFLERTKDQENKKKLATKAMLRRVKLFIENSAFDDFRILQKRGGSGIPLSMSDSICKKIKSSIIDDFGNQPLSNHTDGALKFSSIEIITSQDSKFQMSPMKFLGDSDSAKYPKKSCEVWIDGKISTELHQG